MPKCGKYRMEKQSSIPSAVTNGMKLSGNSRVFCMNSYLSLWIDDYDQVAPESHHLSNILKALPLLQHFSNNFRTQQCLGWAIAVFATWALLSSDPFHSSGTTSNNDKATLFIVKHSELDMKLNFRFILEVLELNTMRQSITYAVIWQNAYRPVSTLRFHSIIHTPLLTFSFSIVASNHHVYQEDQQDPQINIIPCQDDTILRCRSALKLKIKGFKTMSLEQKNDLEKCTLKQGSIPKTQQCSLMMQNLSLVEVKRTTLTLMEPKSLGNSFELLTVTLGAVYFTDNICASLLGTALTAVHHVHLSRLFIPPAVTTPTRHSLGALEHNENNTQKKRKRWEWLPICHMMSLDTGQPRSKTRARSEDDSCTRNWLAANLVEEDKIQVFDQTGIFLMACRHGFVKSVAEMKHSGELAKTNKITSSSFLTYTLLHFGSDFGLSQPAQLSSQAAKDEAKSLY
ncbi:hypothetical protein SERLA73DRAFT_162551 [Serpula lacrymans var. lacrymans S7.3]|uniref:Uncharacterized protein n=1 Tax=Serpula lacrymans var. lacrymans (strain S7.3) TaxID=936435 RepID=F8Q8F0_SERL3|nr:hypothetical protein SERLA73DRAFT_162551 [Serpula lacrymans var. lacrymans S7.3]